VAGPDACPGAAPGPGPGRGSTPEFDRPVWDAETILLKGHALTDPEAGQQLGTDGLATLREVAESLCRWSR
jgi:hypothetical protein